jgi:hypothetical protein
MVVSGEPSPLPSTLFRLGLHIETKPTYRNTTHLKMDPTNSPAMYFISALIESEHKHMALMEQARSDAPTPRLACR